MTFFIFIYNMQLITQVLLLTRSLTMPRSFFLIVLCYAYFCLLNIVSAAMEAASDAYDNYCVIVMSNATNSLSILVAGFLR